ncbi:MAG: hypothetical protein ACLTND_00415 [Ruminococcus bicirculans (ex Wegman et al. 2014)]|nr:MAG: hypothetical protein BHW52_05840 [Ruminococcus sp. 37_24]
MKLNLFATKLEENHTYIMKNIVKRIAAQDDYVRVNYRIDNISNATSVSYRTTVGGTYIASGEISSKGNHTTKHTNATYIDKGERILCTMSLNPAPSGVGSQASGYVSGK